MALMADSPAERVEQLLALSERLEAMVEAGLAALLAGDPAGGAPSDEFLRLANAYRQEMARIRDNPALVAGAPEAARRTLRDLTQRLQGRLDAYVAALNAVRSVTEGLLEAIALELQRVRTAQSGYGAGGAPKSATAAQAPLALDKRA